MNFKKTIILLSSFFLLTSCGNKGPQGLQGVPGKDGITPNFRINDESNKWEVSYDNGLSWLALGISATGPRGENGYSAFETYCEYYPEYKKTEEEWIEDLVEGNLKIKNYDNIYFYIATDIKGNESLNDKRRIVIEGNKLTLYTADNQYGQAYNVYFSGNILYTTDYEGDKDNYNYILLCYKIDDGFLSVLTQDLSKEQYCTEEYFNKNFSFQ